MKKFLQYAFLLIASLVVIAIFVTATTYEQLIAATVLYPLLVYCAFKVFPRKTEVADPTKIVHPVIMSPAPQPPEHKAAGETGKIIDIDKRGFLKMIGAAGLTFFLFSLFNKRVDGLPFFGKATNMPTSTKLEDTTGSKINPAQSQPTDGYKISEFEDNAIAFYGFVKKGGAWFIMREDTTTGSFRYVKGDSQFSTSWSNRENLSYDYYSNVF